MDQNEENVEKMYSEKKTFYNAFNQYVFNHKGMQSTKIRTIISTFMFSKNLKVTKYNLFIICKYHN